MRVGFDAGPALSSYGGIGQYVRCLFPAMFKLSPAIEWIAYSSKLPAQTFPLHLYSHVSLKEPAPRGKLGLTSTRQDHLHLFHGTNFKAPNYGQQCTVLTIHDLWLARNPQYSRKLFGEMFATWKLRLRARGVARVIAISQFTAKELEEMFHLPSDRIAVIYLGCSPGMFPGREEQKFQEVRARLHIPSRPFMLFVGGAEPRKNHTVLFKAFARSARLVKSCVLVAVGAVQTRGASLVETARQLGISESVCCPGYVSTEDLRILYAHAEAFVLPSLYEGSGIPLLDAMACGAPVITGTGSALPEVAGEAALLVNPLDPDQLGTELERLVSDRDLQEHLRQKGFERVTHFTWERAAQETLALYREVLG
jgi:glycosyltransferase involved in cell wall biosynthesis